MQTEMEDFSTFLLCGLLINALFDKFLLFTFLNIKLTCEFLLFCYHTYTVFKIYTHMVKLLKTKKIVILKSYFLF